MFQKSLIILIYITLLSLAYIIISTHHPPQPPKPIEANKLLRIAKASIESNANHFYQLPQTFQQDPEVALLAIEKDHTIYSELYILLKEDDDFVLEAVKRNHAVYVLLSDRLKMNPKIKKAREEIIEGLRKDFLKTFDKKWVKINGGSFIMGSDWNEDELPIHSVLVKDFKITKTEVTVGEYRKCVEAMICSIPEDHDFMDDCNWHHADRENHPVNCVDWRQARTFGKWVGGDLPSEAQWEYASRSEGKDMRYPWGNEEPGCEMVNAFYACHKKTTPVCSKTGNTIQGLCDMGGNVDEWVLDEWHDSYNDAPLDDTAWCHPNGCQSDANTGIGRGGAWDAHTLDLRTSKRHKYYIGARYGYIGFRVIKK